MATQIIDLSSSNGLVRPLANFPPSVWGDRFLLPDLEYNKVMKGCEKQLLMIEVLTQDLKRELRETTQCTLKQLQLIDTIQRLGVEYHFEVEIDRALQNIYDNSIDFYKHDKDLCSLALSFRLLRQQGHNVPCDIFEKFKDGKGAFNISIATDAIGMLEFYEATYLSIQGENMLDEGRVFTRTQLRSMLPNLSNPVAEQISYALENYSNRRGLPRLEARRYISTYEQNSSCHESLLKLAKLDFNLLQSLHKMELSEIYRWWKGLDVKENFSYARDRCVECYFWAFGVYFEPKYALARRFLGRALALGSILDDTYDAYGTFEELQSFNEAIQRWSNTCSDSLPGYMKVLYKAILEMIEEIEGEMVKQGVEYRVRYAKEAMKTMVRSYFHEAKWRHEKYTPTTHEHLSVATKSCCYTSLTIISFIGMGDIVTKEAFDWVLTLPPIMRSSEIICRLTDDIVGHEFEQERDHIPSSIECYMKEHHVTQQEAIDEFNIRIEAAWKDINQEFLRPTKVASPMLYRILNFTRIIEVMYRKGDWYTHVGPEMQSYIKRLLIDPIEA